MTEPTHEQKLISYLLTVIRQRSNERAKDSQQHVVPDWVPSRIQLKRMISSFDGTTTFEPGEYDCQTNVFGAIVLIDSEGRRLGVMHHECEILAMRPNRKKQIDEARAAEEQAQQDSSP